MAFLIILISVSLFTLIILSLIGLISLVEKKLFGQGTFAVDINAGARSLAALSGETLLKALQRQDVFLPSGCGGKGTCGECACRIFSGAGRLLPTEEAVIPRPRQRESFRLSCQVKIREDVKVALEDDVFRAVKFEARVLSNRPLTPWIKELRLSIPDETWGYQAGQYVQIDIPVYQRRLAEGDVLPAFRGAWARRGLTNLEIENEEPTFRAYSIASHPSEKGIITLNIRLALPPEGDPWVPAGVASSHLFTLSPGQTVAVSGPFGRFLVKDSRREKVYIAGGVGLAGVRSHLYEWLEKRGEVGEKISLWVGARSREDLYYLDEIQRWAARHVNFSFHVAFSSPVGEEDGEEAGDRGMVHEVLSRRYLQGHPCPEEIDYYFCGPAPMIRAVVDLLDGLGVPAGRMAYDDFGG